jgi:enolase
MPDSLPNIAHLNTKLAVDNQRVNQWVDGLVERMDKIVDATTRSDWMEVKRLSLFIARSSAIYGFPLLAENAERLANASDNQDATEIKRGVIKLIGAAGRARKPAQ